MRRTLNMPFTPTNWIGACVYLSNACLAAARLRAFLRFLCVFALLLVARLLLWLLL